MTTNNLAGQLAELRFKITGYKPRRETVRV